jgi:FlaA1/EpsC-like NDP-sugar epimerase
MTGPWTAINLSKHLTTHRTAVQVLYDFLCWAVAVAVAVFLRYDLDFRGVSTAAALRILPVILVSQVAAGLLFGMYRGQWRFGSFEEILALAKGVVLTSALVFLANLIMSPQPVPRSVPLGAGIAALVLMGSGRYLWRWGDERDRRPTAPDCERLLVFGAGDGGSEIIRAMLSNRQGRYLPVALLDDDPAKRNLRIQGVPVLGGRRTMTDAAANKRADAVLIAVRNANAALVTEISELAFACGLGVKVLPPVNELLGARVAASDPDISAG